MVKRFFVISALLCALSGCFNNIRSKNEQDNTGQQIMIDKWIYKINKRSLGIDQDLKKDFGIDKEIVKYHISVLTKEKKVLIQEIRLEDESDIIISIEKDQLIYTDLIKVKFKFNKFTTEPAGYTGYKFYKASKTDGMLTPIFAYFEKAGGNNEPSAELTEIKRNGDKLELNYLYYESEGLSVLGKGDVKLIYGIDINSGKIVFSDISCGIIRKARYIGGRFDSADPSYRLETPENIHYTKEQLNDKLKYLLTVYPFVY